MRATAIGLAAIVLAIAVAWTSLNASANTSGPDPSGYTWTDSNAPAPFITPNFIDISATGTMIDNDTDFIGSAEDGIFAQALPFPFVFFGNTYNSVQISTNGFISFSALDPLNPDNCNYNYNWGVNDEGHPIPHGDEDCDGGHNGGWGSNPLIAAFFDDLDPGNCGNVYHATTGTAPNRMFTVQWNDVCHSDCHHGSSCEAGKGVTFEIILYEGSNDVRVEYADGFFDAGMPLLNNGASATTGLSFDSTTGLQYSYDQQILTDGLAVLYSPGTMATATPSPTATPVGSETATPSGAPSTPTPTSTPAGQTVMWGDDNCSGTAADPVDSLLTLRHDAGLSADTGDCPALGTSVDVVDASLHLWGDVDCSSAVDPVDSLKILRSDAGLGVTQEADCPAMGQQVQITPQ